MRQNFQRHHPQRQEYIARLYFDFDNTGRHKMKTFPSFDNIKSELFKNDTSEELHIKSVQEQKLGKTLEQITESLEFTNNKRLRFILIAKILFAIALVCMFFSTITFIVCVWHTTSSLKM